jgi:hypothetical protein
MGLKSHFHFVLIQHHDIQNSHGAGKLKCMHRKSGLFFVAGTDDPKYVCNCVFVCTFRWLLFFMYMNGDMSQFS